VQHLLQRGIQPTGVAPAPNTCALAGICHARLARRAPGHENDGDTSSERRKNGSGAGVRDDDLARRNQAGERNELTRVDQALIYFASSRLSSSLGAVTTTRIPRDVHARTAAANSRRALEKAGTVPIHATRELMRTAERELALQAEASYRQMVNDQQAGGPTRKVGASAIPERAEV
jgi:hypothetical protein